MSVSLSTSLLSAAIEQWWFHLVINQKRTLLLELLQVLVVKEVPYSSSKNRLCVYLILNKVICGYFTAKWGQRVFILIWDCFSTDHKTVGFSDQSHNAWLLSRRWADQELRKSRVVNRLIAFSCRDKGDFMHISMLYSCSCVMPHLQNVTQNSYHFCFTHIHTQFGFVSAKVQSMSWLTVLLKWP